MKHLIFVVSCMIYFSCFSQVQLNWYEGSCLKTGQIDTTKYTYTEAQNIYYFFVDAAEMQQPFLMDELKDTSKINLKNIQEECKQYLQSYHALQLPASSIWEKYRKEKIESIKRGCYLKEIAVISIETPKKFKPKGTSKVCLKYSNTIRKGGKKLLESWKEIHRSELINALDSVAIEKDFQRKWQHVDKLKFARLEVLKYGWWNCIRNEDQSTLNQIEIKKEFEKLFTSISTSCN